MAAAIDVFRTEAMAALDGLDMDIRRALEWIHGDRREHWNHEVRRGWDRITQARLQLHQARTARRVDDHEPDCADEKKALARAQRRLETAQEKVEAVRHCARAIDEAVHDYRGARVPLVSWLESEAPKALAVLRRMMDNLDRYVALQAPSGTMTGSPLSSPASRGEEEAQTRGQSASVPSTEYSVPSTDAAKTEANEQAPSVLSTENSVLSTGDAGARSTGFSRNPTNVPPEGGTANHGGPA